jgi:glycosyltransferase involved in cell wall biosynthesis
MFERMPATADDYAGVFSLDYLEAMRRTCRVTVLMPGRTGGRGLSGHATEEAGGELTWTPWLSGGGQARQRFARLEALVELSRLGKHLPAIDLIHAHGPIFHGSAALALGRKLAVPTVLTVHTGPFRKVLERRTVKLLTRRTLEGVDCVCPVSDDLRRQIETSGIRPRRIEVTYNPVNTDLFLPGQQNSSQTRRIVFAGRLEEYKGALRVIRAFSEIFERWPNWKLTIAGDGPERGHLDEFLRQHQALSERVEMLGSYTRPQLAAQLAE